MMIIELALRCKNPPYLWRDVLAAKLLEPLAANGRRIGLFNDLAGSCVVSTLAADGCIDAIEQPSFSAAKRGMMIFLGHQEVGDTIHRGRKQVRCRGQSPILPRFVASFTSFIASFRQTNYMSDGAGTL
jgi:hypothetical protein